MEILFLLNAVVTLAIAGLLAYCFVKHYSNDEVNKASNWFSLSFFGYAVVSLFSFFWFFGKYEFNNFDFSMIYSLAVFVQTFVLFRSFKNYSKNKNLMYWLLFYFACAFSVLISVSYLPSIILTISFFLTLVLLFGFVFRAEFFKKITSAGIFYSFPSLVFTFLVFFGIGNLFLFSFISNILFLVFVYFFVKDSQNFPLRTESKIKGDGEHGVLLFFKYFVFMIVLINLVLITTVSVHEFGHIAVSRFYGCEARTIVYEEGSYPYSEILCDNFTGKIFIALAGPVIPTIIALLLLIIGGRYIRPISFLVIGFNLLASYRDLGDVGLSDNLVVTSTVLGIVFLLFGVALLAKARMQDGSRELI